jgi:hypothetical protein
VADDAGARWAGPVAPPGDDGAVLGERVIGTPAPPGSTGPVAAQPASTTRTPSRAVRRVGPVDRLGEYFKFLT